MAHPDGTSARAHRLIGLAAALLLAVTTALAFGRVFLGAPATLKLLAVAAASAGVAVIFERRSLLLATAASAAGVAIAVGLAVFPDTTWYGLPTSDTLRAALDAAGVVGEQARIQVAPAEPIAPLLLAAVVSLWAAVFSAHALAFRAGSPLLGLIPPVALVAFADTVLEQFVKPLYGLAFLAAALLVVFADGLARVQGWGPVWSSSRRGVASVAGRGARRLAATALAAGLVAPILVPGFGSKAVIDFGTASEDRIAIDPFVSVQNQLSRRDPVDVLRVSSPRPTYLRLVSLPIFDGAGWWPDRDRTGIPVPPGGPVPAVEGSFGETRTVSVDVLHDLGMPWLPAAYPVTSIEAPSSTVSYDAATGTAFVAAPLREGDRYEMGAAFVTETDDRLRSIGDSTGFGRPETGNPYLQLPDDLPAEIEQIARAWTEGQGSVYDKAAAIQDRLQGPDFRYVENVDGGGTHTILTFLTETKAGFCQQFAASMAVLLRTLDIPARVVVGFAQGTEDPTTGGYTVTSDRAHAWVEVRFPGIGWMPFEPTPGRTNPVTLAYTQPEPECPPDCETGQGQPQGGQQNGQVTAIDRAFERDPRTGGRRPSTGFEPFEPTPRLTGASARIVLLGAALAAVVVFLLLVPPVRALQRRVRLRRAAAEPRRLILVTYEQFTERAAGLGLGRGLGETLDEYRRKVLETGYVPDGHLDRLTTIATSAAYSPRTPGADEAREATDAASTALAGIRRAVGPARWLTGLYRR